MLLIKRSAHLSFGSSYAFPGGNIDTEDATIAGKNQQIIDQNHRQYYSTEFTKWYPSALVCAIRETIEEVGLPMDYNKAYIHSMPFLRIITP